MGRRVIKLGKIKSIQMKIIAKKKYWIRKQNEIIIQKYFFYEKVQKNEKIQK